MEAVKEIIKTTNGAKPTITPDDAIRQVAELLQSIGYDGLGVIAVGPRTGQPHNPMDFLPEGWQLVIVPTKREMNGDSI